MSKLYGTLSGDGRAGEQTRCANKVTRATAQSWEGSIMAAIKRMGSDGTHLFDVHTDSGSCAYPGHLLLDGTIANGKLTFGYVAPEIVEWVLANHKAEQDGEVTK